MIRYRVSQDMVTGRGVGFRGLSASGLDSVPVDRLRFDGAAIVDVSEWAQFFIDSDGIKHIVRHDQAWQPLACAFSDGVIFDGGSWRIKTPVDAWRGVQDAAYIDFKSSIYRHVVHANNFPEWRQANNNQRYTQLAIAEISGPLSQADAAELDLIRQIIAWKDSILAEKDRVKTAIYAATNSTELQAAVGGAVLPDAPFAL